MNNTKQFTIRWTGLEKLNISKEYKVLMLNKSKFSLMGNVIKFKSR